MLPKIALVLLRVKELRDSKAPIFFEHLTSTAQIGRVTDSFCVLLAERAEFPIALFPKLRSALASSLEISLQYQRISPVGELPSDPLRCEVAFEKGKSAWIGLHLHLEDAFAEKMKSLPGQPSSELTTVKQTLQSLCSTSYSVKVNWIQSQKILEVICQINTQQISQKWVESLQVGDFHWNEVGDYVVDDSPTGDKSKDSKDDSEIDLKDIPVSLSDVVTVVEDPGFDSTLGKENATGSAEEDGEKAVGTGSGGAADENSLSVGEILKRAASGDASFDLASRNRKVGDILSQAIDEEKKRELLLQELTESEMASLLAETETEESAELISEDLSKSDLQKLLTENLSDQQKAEVIAEGNVEGSAKILEKALEDDEIKQLLTETLSDEKQAETLVAGAADLAAEILQETLSRTEMAEVLKEALEVEEQGRILKEEMSQEALAEVMSEGLTDREKASAIFADDEELVGKTLKDSLSKEVIEELLASALPDEEKAKALAKQLSEEEVARLIAERLTDEEKAQVFAKGDPETVAKILKNLLDKDQITQIVKDALPEEDKAKVLMEVLGEAETAEMLSEELSQKEKARVIAAGSPEKASKLLQKSLEKSEMAQILSDALPEEEVASVLTDTMAPEDIAQTISQNLSDQEKAKVIAGADPDQAVAVIRGTMDEAEIAEMIASALPDEDLAQALVKGMPEDDVAKLVKGSMPEDEFAELLKGVLPPEEVAKVFQSTMPAEEFTRFLQQSLPPEEFTKIVSDGLKPEEIANIIKKDFPPEELVQKMMAGLPPSEVMKMIKDAIPQEELAKIVAQELPKEELAKALSTGLGPAELMDLFKIAGFTEEDLKAMAIQAIEIQTAGEDLGSSVSLLSGMSEENRQLLESVSALPVESISTDSLISTLENVMPAPLFDSLVSGEMSAGEIQSLVGTLLPDSPAKEKITKDLVAFGEEKSRGKKDKKKGLELVKGQKSGDDGEAFLVKGESAKESAMTLLQQKSNFSEKIQDKLTAANVKIPEAVSQALMKEMGDVQKTADFYKSRTGELEREKKRLESEIKRLEADAKKAKKQESKPGAKIGSTAYTSTKAPLEKEGSLGKPKKIETQKEDSESVQAYKQKIAAEAQDSNEKVTPTPPEEQKRILSLKPDAPELKTRLGLDAKASVEDQLVAQQKKIFELEKKLERAEKRVTKSQTVADQAKSGTLKETRNIEEQQTGPKAKAPKESRLLQSEPVSDAQKIEQIKREKDAEILKLKTQITSFENEKKKWEEEKRQKETAAQRTSTEISRTPEEEKIDQEIDTVKPNTATEDGKALKKAQDRLKEYQKKLADANQLKTETQTELKEKQILIEKLEFQLKEAGKDKGETPSSTEKSEGETKAHVERTVNPAEEKEIKEQPVEKRAELYETKWKTALADASKLKEELDALKQELAAANAQKPAVEVVTEKPTENEDIVRKALSEEPEKTLAEKAPQMFEKTDSSVTKVTKDMEAMKQELKDERQRARMDLMVKELRNQQVELDHMKKTLTESIKKKEHHFRTALGRAQEELVRTQSGLKEKSLDNDRLKQNVMELNKKLEKIGGNNELKSDESTQLKLKLDHSQRQVDELKKEIQKLTKRLATQPDRAQIQTSAKEEELKKQLEQVKKAVEVKKQEADILKKNINEKSLAEVEYKRQIVKLQNDIKTLQTQLKKAA